MTQPLTKDSLSSRNKAVSSSYLLIFKVAKQLLSTLPQELLRYYIERSNTNKLQVQNLHEFISPLFYLCLRDDDTGYIIHFGFDPSKEFANITGQFIRVIYKLTMQDYTAVNIEDCISPDSIITNTAHMFDYTHWLHPNLPTDVIKYKPSQVKRKVLSVA
jgi:hypothetical protein